MSVGIKGPGGGRKIPVNPWEGSTTITPSAEDKIIPAYTDKELTVEGDKDLVGENILSSKNIFGVQGAIPLKAAETFTPGTAAKTIASGRYLSGTQTIKGDANLKPENILTDKSIFGILGNVVKGVDLSRAGITKGATGTITPAVSPLNFEITHKLGVKPKHVIFLASRLNASEDNKSVLLFITTLPSGLTNVGFCGRIYTYKPSYMQTIGYNTVFDSLSSQAGDNALIDTTRLILYNERTLMVGVPYTWIALG